MFFAIDTPNFGDYAEQGAAGVTIERAPEPPQLHPVSGKFQHVWSDVKQQSAVMFNETPLSALHA